ncbi:MAG: hypothetical protein GC131_07005 [Alphaproteobacteria bacterium]|nr:hypothetical protein [Alphaproteobacteria bacterium]
MKKPALFLPLLALLLALFAPAPAPAAEPDIAKMPMIKAMQDSGTKFYYLGEHSGLHGWLILNNGRLNVLYLTPDKTGFIFSGSIISGDGGNITQLQIASAITKNDDLKARVEGLAAGKGAPPPAVSIEKEGMPVPGGAISPGEQLIADMESAAGMTVGEATAPLLMMVVDPRCPYCKETWRALRDVVSVGGLRVKLIPIGAQGSENEREAAVFLRAETPLATWNAFIDDDKSVLAGEATDRAIQQVRANGGIVLRWKIEHTPYLVYRDASGKVKIVVGQPDNMAAVLDDLVAR